MATNRVMTVRIEAELLERVREAARREQRSVSGQMLFLVRKGLEERPERRRRRPTMGWLSGRKVPASPAEFKRLRRALSADLDGHLRRWRAR